MSPGTPDRLLDRLMAALLVPRQGGGPSLVIAAYRPPIVVLELPDEGTAVAIVDRGEADPTDVRAELERMLSRHEAGLLFVVLVGGADTARAALIEADRHAPHPGQLGTYHLDKSGKIAHVAGRRLRLLAKLARDVANVVPIDAPEIPRIIATAEREREEAAAFAARLEKRPAPMTIAIGSACVLMHLVAVALVPAGSAQDGLSETLPVLSLVRLGANGASLIAAGEPWRLLSYAFLHANLLHLIFNMVALVSFGAFLEGLVGWRRYVVLYGSAALGGGIASAVVAGQPLSVGASGAIWGLMAAGLGMILRQDDLVPRRLALRLRRRLLSVLAINAALSFVPGIDLFAHFGGGVTGFALAFVGVAGRRKRNPDEPESRVIRIAAHATLGALVGSVALALVLGRAWVP